MTDFVAQRENMVESQVRPNGVTDRRILDAMSEVPRENFVPQNRRAVAYMDEDVDLGGGRCLIEAMAFAKLLQLAEVTAEDRLLLVGGGMGYGAAVASRLAKDVVVLEPSSELAGAAKNALSGNGNVKVLEGGLAEGARAHGPFDAIVFEGRVWDVPDAYLSQLASGGRIVAVVGEGEVAKAQVMTLVGKSLSRKVHFDASIAPLPGLAKRQPAFVF